MPSTPQLSLDQLQTLFFAIVKQCKVRQSKEGFWEYSILGGLEVVDIRLVQCVVHQIFDQGKWVRSGEHAHANIKADAMVPEWG